MNKNNFHHQIFVCNIRILEGDTKALLAAQGRRTKNCPV